MTSLTRKPPVTWAGNYIRERKPYCTDRDIDLTHFRIMGYVSGRAIHVHALTWYHFDSVTYLGHSDNPINHERGHQFLCHRYSGKDGKASNTVVIADKIK